MKKFTLLLIAAALLLSLAACSPVEEPAGNDSINEPPTDGADASGAPEHEDNAADEVRVEIPSGHIISLSDDAVTMDGSALTEDMTDVYTARDIVYYRAGLGFTYGEGTEEDEHSQEEADSHTVVHIASPGTYVLTGKLSAGQVAVDLGEDAESDPSAVVNLVLDDADITCTVAPAIIFYNVYECGDKDTASSTVDTSSAGANVYIADGSVNTLNGSYVARIYKSIELSEDKTEVIDSKKLHKYDGALYSKMSMNVTGNDGVLNINAENEGLDTELHLTINGGVINIVSGNDGINTNEDGVSVTTVNGGLLTVTVNGSTGEGDGIDSNGWLVINGGTVRAYACSTSGDAGIDSDMGIIINGGEVIATGNMLDAIDGASTQSYVLFNSLRSKGGTSFTLKDAEGAELMDVPVSENSFSILIVSGPKLTSDGLCALYEGSTLIASATPGGADRGGFGGGGMRPGNGERPEMPEGFDSQNPSEDFRGGNRGGFGGETPPEAPDGQQPPEAPDGQEPPEVPENGAPSIGTPV